jgi:hypothetical protein
VREASCSCGQLRLTAEGEPVRISICHCLACQQRTGSAFGYQARFPVANVEITGRATEYLRVSDEGEERLFRFCPECGSTVYYTSPAEPDLVAVTAGSFADPAFPAPAISVWESRKHAWVSVPTADVHRD